MNTIYKNKSELIARIVPKGASVLDVGFWGQGVSVNDANWVHSILKARTADVYGLDLEFNEKAFADSEKYIKASAEDFSISKRFDVIFAGDLVEHLSNPGLFLAAAKRHLKPGGKLVMTTPNAFNLFNITEKLTKAEPTVNRDHTCYFNSKTLGQLLKKNGWEADSIDYVYSLGLKHKESLKKKALNVVYKLLSLATTKFVETLVVVASPR